MSPVELAADVYNHEACARSFREDLEAHLMHGYVFSTPSYFVMGRPVNRLASYEELTNPWVTFTNPDAWWVYLAAGDMSQIISACPHQLPFVGFERQNKPRFYGTEKLFSLICHESNPSILLSCVHVVASD